MTKPTLLLDRLNAIGHSLEQSGHGLALIGLGSVGLELDRMDDYSDLDFFAIVDDGFKNQFIENLNWLSSLCPITYCFKNSPDGYKLLFQDGIFCEFAVFELSELQHIPFSAGRIVWKQPHISDQIAHPVSKPQPSEGQSVEWLVGEAVTNLYVGLGRFHRGEKLSASRFIQNYAVDRILILASLIETPSAAHPDIFSIERRFEQRFPHLSKSLPSFVQGYDNCRESARCILEFLEQHFEVNRSMADAVRELL